MSNWQELANKYIINFIKRTPLTLVKGEGARVWDDTGKKYLDFVGGWAVDSLGHCHPVLAKALAEQARTLIQVSNQYYTIPMAQLAELLVKNSCMQKVFICNSGAEACEGAVKLARRYGQINLKGAYEVITALNSFHGRTLMMTAATGQEKSQKPYQPIPAGFVHVPFNDIEAIKKATTDKTCAVMVEPIQGEGGVNMPAEDYLTRLRDWCNQKGILLILDEVQTGLGRTGSLFAYQQYGMEPDIMTLAKGLASGVAIGAFLAKERAAVFQPGEHGSTFGGNPLACAAAYAVTKFIIDNDIPEKVKKVGNYLIASLEPWKKKYPFIKEVRGRGLLVGMEFNEDIAEGVMLACLERGLLINLLKPNLLRFIPPLIIGNAEVDEALGILEKALSTIKK
jgi:acetylornithine/N-succinyldiaminopimelate aminotransferase